MRVTSLTENKIDKDIETGDEDTWFEKVHEKAPEKKEKEKKPQVAKVPLYKLFHFANGYVTPSVVIDQPSLDTFLLLVGFLCAAAHGTVMPGFSLIFGKLIDSFNVQEPNTTYDKATSMNEIKSHIFR